jgi:hypothetical protein
LIKAGVPQGNVLGPILYLLYINDVPTTLNSTTATFAHDTALMAVGETVESSSRKLQSVVNNLHLYNATLRLNYWLPSLKIAQIKMILKPGKNPTDVPSYRPISLLSTIAKLLERLILPRIYQDSNPTNWTPDHQFGFRSAHSTIQQGHRIINTINQVLNNNQYCTAVFLDVAQTFDKVWHPGLAYKIKTLLPPQYFSLLHAYLRKRKFVVKVNNELSRKIPILSGVPEGSLLSPLLYTIYNHDLPTSPDTLTGTFADDTAIFSSHENPQSESESLYD